MFGDVRLGDLMLDREAQDWRLFLCKPDKSVIAPVKDVEDLSYNLRAGKVDEVSFTIPSQVNIDHELVTNPLIRKVKHRYLFKLIYNNRTTYLIFNEEDKTYGNNETVSYKLYGLGYMLRDKTIRDWSATSKNLTQMLDEVLQETNWKVGFVDADINLKYRSHEVSNNTVLEVVYELADKFNGLIEWDTINQRINVYKPNSLGQNKGFRLREGKYLESFTMTSNSDEVVTRLKVYGKDGLTFRRLSPTGSNYIEDFTYFLYPFELDENGKVVRHSDYMSDGLARGIIDYQNHLESIQGQFDSLTSLLTSIEDQIQQRDQELSVLLTELKVIIDEQDVYNSTKSGNINDIVARRNAKQAEIDLKAKQISDLEKEYNSYQTNINDLRDGVQLSNFLTADEMLELNNFIITKDYTNESIVEEQDLLEDGIEAFKTFRQPKVSLNIDIVNFLKNLESQNDWDKIGLGDTILISNERLGVDISAKIIEIQFNLTDNDIGLVLANEHELMDSDEMFLDKIYNAVNTSTSVNMNQWKWDLVEDTNTLVNRLLTEGLNAADRAITAGYKQNVKINERGIIIQSDQEPHKWIIMQNGVIGLTRDNGQSWEVAVTPDGVYAQTLIGKIIMGSRLIIEDENGIIRLSGSKQEIFDAAGNTKVELGEYEKGKYGLKIYNGAIEIVNGLPEEQIDPEATRKWNAAEQNAIDWTKDYVESIRSEIDTEVDNIRELLANFSAETIEIFRDGIIDEAEKKSIETYINLLNTEKGDIDRRYTSILNDPYMTDDTVRGNLATAKTNYDTAHTTLIDTINEAISDDTATDMERNNVNNQFENYRNRVFEITEALEFAVRSLEAARIDAIEIGGRNLILFSNETITSSTNLVQEYQLAEDWKLGQTYTIVLEGTINEGQTFEIWANGSSTRVATLDYDAANGVYRKTFTTPSTINNQTPRTLRVYNAPSETATSASIVRIKMEKGNKATDYTPAYEDIFGRIEAVRNDVGDVSDKYDELVREINSSFKDGIISEAEAKAIGKYINSLTAEKEDLDSRYVAVYADINLPELNRTSLQTAKTNFNAAHSNLINTINNAIVDGTATPSESLEVDSKFSAYNSALSTLSTQLEEAIKAIASAMAAKAEAEANKYTNGKVNEINSEISELSSSVTSLQDALGQIVLDGEVGAEERARLMALMDSLAIEKADVDEQYRAVYNDPNIPVANQTALQSTKSTLNTAHDTLVATINTALADSFVTDAEKIAANEAFTSYRTALTTFSSTIQTAVLAIAQNVGEKVETNLRSYADDTGGKIRNDLRLVAPLPTSIEMDSSGITAYTLGNKNQFAALDYRGLYVQGGAIDIRTSGSNLNRGVRIDGSGIHGYNSNGVKTFHVDNSGNLTATSGKFSGDITGASGKFSGELDAASGTFRGRLSGVDGTFTRLTSGTIDGATITGSTISTRQDVKVGKNLEIASNVGQYTGIFFKGYSGSSSTLPIETRAEISLGSSLGERLRIWGNMGVDISGNVGMITMDRTNFEDTTNFYGTATFRSTVDFTNANVLGIKTDSVATFG